MEESAATDFAAKAVSVFKDCSQVPVASGARVYSDDGKCRCIGVTFSQKDLERGKKLSYRKNFFVTGGRDGAAVEPVCEVPFQSDCTNV